MVPLILMHIGLPPNICTHLVLDREMDSAVETRAAAKKKSKPTKPLHVSSPRADVSHPEFVQAFVFYTFQHSTKTLHKIT